MKKILSLCLALLLLLVGCQSGKKNTQKEVIVTTIYPITYLTERIVGDALEVHQIVPVGADTHNWEPTSKDVAEIYDAKAFIYNGVGIEHWVDDILKTVETSSVSIIEASHDVALLTSTHHHDHHEGHEEHENKTLGDFSGAWKSLEIYIENGEAKPYLEEHAKQHNEAVEEVQQEVLESIKSVYKELEIKGHQLVDVAHNVTSSYIDEGLVDGEGGEWFRFKKVQEVPELPNYLLISAESTNRVLTVLTSDDSYDDALDRHQQAIYLAANSSQEDLKEVFEHQHSHEEEQNQQYDPHTFNTPKNLLTELDTIYKSLVEIDPSHKELFTENYQKVKAELEQLDQEYTNTLSSVSNRSFVVSHEAFGYLAQQYHLEQIGIEGINPHSEPDVNRVVEVIEMIKEKGVKVIFFENTATSKLAKTIAETTDIKVDVLYPLETITNTQVSKQEDLLVLLKKNLKALENALK